MTAAEPVPARPPDSVASRAQRLSPSCPVAVGIDAPARGLVITVRLNPGRPCNFDCVHCPVDRRAAGATRFNVDHMAAELRAALAGARAGDFQRDPRFRAVPPELLVLRHVVLEGEGEPTLAPEFPDAVEAVVHVRAQRGGSFFKLVLRTNGSRLDTPPVQAALAYFTRADEVRVKLDAGTQAWMDRVNRPDCTLERVLANIALVARRQPVVIETVFSAVAGHAPSPAEIQAYCGRLRALREEGARLALVRLRPAGGRCGDSACRQMPLRQLSEIAQRVRAATGLRVEIS